MSIEQEISIDATPDAIYEILLGSTKFTEMTGGRDASISAEEGGEISLFGGAISGRNIELVPGKRVVQSWRSADWPEGVHSVVTFDLSKQGSGTTLKFSQAGHPEAATEHLEAGWHQMYWDPMKAMLS